MQVVADAPAGETRGKHLVWGGVVAAVLKEASSEGGGPFCLPLFDADSRGFRNSTALPSGLNGDILEISHFSLGFFRNPPVTPQNTQLL